MHPFPHLYTVNARCQPSGNVTLASSGLANLPSAPPAEFDGPGDQWSPETLLCAAVADCFNLSFRAVAAASKFTWESLDCEVRGTLDRIERVSQFTRFDIQATLKLPAGADSARAQHLLEKSKQVCLISNSLKGEFHLTTQITI